VIAPDINLLIYAVDEDSPYHTVARAVVGCDYGARPPSF
jgi:predicted nucleic acid-binding protein